MCCFSVTAPLGFFGQLFAPKVHVSATNIFARMIAPGVQVLAYGMNLETKREVAMILPLPVVRDAGEDAVKFVDLARHPSMFQIMASLFEVVVAQRKGGFALQLLSASKLKVHEVGSFIASYVPRREDFARLDERFRLPDVLFDAVPAYADYGFAVFQLAPGKVTVHPMAMTFPTRAPDKLFFPTVHVHDGRWKPTAKFDHALYYQHPNCPDTGQSGGTFNNDMIGAMYTRETFEDVVLRDTPVVRRTLRERLPNEDVWIAAT